ncbi:MAG TPA: NAD(P)-dependent oxidoreductase [Dehalococcoidia bacterium]|nr:NAD(P)-dependent oxidoreductase [Dehalococcoidia bacterium]
MTTLITGGLGFIGLYTAQQLLDAGEDVVLTRHRRRTDPEFLAPEVGKRVFIEQLDVSDREAVAGIGRRYEIDGICHLAGAGYSAPSLEADFGSTMGGLINVLSAASHWQVRKLAIASSITVYAGIDTGPFREDMGLRTEATSGPVETYKKVHEIVGTHYAERSGLDVVFLRIGLIYGRQHRLGNIVGRLTRAALGTQPLEGEVYEDDSGDLCHVEDCARAIAALQLAPKLPQRIYNIGAGAAGTNRQVADAIERAVPGAKLPLLPGSGPQHRVDPYMDLTRIARDAGYAPKWKLEDGVQDYVAWLQKNPDAV